MYLRKLLIISILFLSSCNLLKKVDKTSTDTESTERIREITSRKGDTVTYEIPNVRFKDTTIYTYNRVGSRIETRYDSKGDIDLINCITGEINMLREEIRSMKESEDTKQKTEQGKANIFVWIGGLIILSGVVLITLKKI